MSIKKFFWYTCTCLTVVCLFSCQKTKPHKTYTISGLAIFSGLVKDPSGAAVSGVRVDAYEAFDDELPTVQGIADYQSGVTGRTGRFTLSLPPGKYVFIARKRGNQHSLGGPVAPNDFSSDRTLPLNLNENALLKKNFVLYPLKGLHEGFALSKHFSFKHAVYGKIFNGNKEPVSGVVVVGSRRRRLSKKPDFSSFPVDVEGNFFLPLPSKGTFYLEVRKSVTDSSYLLENGKKYIEVQVEERQVRVNIILPDYSVSN